MNIVSSLVWPLFFTLLIEGVVVFFSGYRTATELRTIFFLNLLTNPLLNYLVLVNSYGGFILLTFSGVLLLELLVVLVEWRILVTLWPTRTSCNLLWLSILMNGTSFFAGYFLWQIIPLG